MCASPWVYCRRGYTRSWHRDSESKETLCYSGSGGIKLLSISVSQPGLKTTSLSPFKERIGRCHRPNLDWVIKALTGTIETYFSSTTGIALVPC